MQSQLYYKKTIGRFVISSRIEIAKLKVSTSKITYFQIASLNNFNFVGFFTRIKTL